MSYRCRTLRGTQCAGGDGPSSVVLDSSGQESTDGNTSSVVSTEAGTHVVHGCNTVTVEHQNVKQSKKKTPAESYLDTYIMLHTLVLKINRKLVMLLIITGKE